MLKSVNLLLLKQHTQVTYNIKLGMKSLTFKVAELVDVPQIVNLINSAYRGEYSRSGWTTEADLLEGRRTNNKEIVDLIRCRKAIILLCKTEQQLLGCVCLKYSDFLIELGMLAVEPSHQGIGIGRQLLHHAELLATQTWSCERFVLEVIHCRHELISFYQRRGYRLTGESRVFPVNPKLWVPKVNNLALIALEKIILHPGEKSS